MKGSHCGPQAFLPQSKLMLIHIRKKMSLLSYMTLFFSKKKSMSALKGVAGKRKHCSRKPSKIEDLFLLFTCFIRESICSQRYMLSNKEIICAAFFSAS